MRKKGFTLVELIVVIALLSIAGTVIAVNLVSLNNQQSTKAKTRIENAIKSAAEAYVSAERLSPNDGDCILINTLIDENYLNESDVSDYQNKYVYITKSSDNVYTYSITSSSSCSTNIYSKEYLVVFDANGGKFTDGETQHSISSGNGQLEIPDTSEYVPVYANDKTFVGWSKKKNATSADYSSGVTINVTKGMTLYAVYQSSGTYVLKYADNSSRYSNLTVTKMPQVQIQNSATFSISSTEPTAKGYSFSSWNTKANGSGIKYKKGDSIEVTDSSTTLYAQWTAKNYTVTFNVNGGNAWTSSTCGSSFTYTSSSNKCSKSITYASTYATLPTPTREGYTFLGWYTSKNGTTKVTSTSTMLTSSAHTLYAHWEKNGPDLYIHGTIADSITINGTTTSIPDEGLILTSVDEDDLADIKLHIKSEYAHYLSKIYINSFYSATVNQELDETNNNLNLELSDFADEDALYLYPYFAIDIYSPLSNLSFTSIDQVLYAESFDSCKQNLECSASEPEWQDVYDVYAYDTTIHADNFELNLNENYVTSIEDYVQMIYEAHRIAIYNIDEAEVSIVYKTNVTSASYGNTSDYFSDYYEQVVDGVKYVGLVLDVENAIINYNPINTDTQMYVIGFYFYITHTLSGLSSTCTGDCFGPFYDGMTIKYGINAGSYKVQVWSSDVVVYVEYLTREFAESNSMYESIYYVNSTSFFSSISGSELLGSSNRLSGKQYSYDLYRVAIGIWNGNTSSSATTNFSTKSIKTGSYNTNDQYTCTSYTNDVCTSWKYTGQG